MQSKTAIAQFLSLSALSIFPAVLAESHNFNWINDQFSNVLAYGQMQYSRCSSDPKICPPTNESCGSTLCVNCPFYQETCCLGRPTDPQACVKRAHPRDLSTPPAAAYAVPMTTADSELGALPSGVLPPGEVPTLAMGPEVGVAAESGDPSSAVETGSAETGSSSGPAETASETEAASAAETAAPSSTDSASPAAATTTTTKTGAASKARGEIGIAVAFLTAAAGAAFLIGDI